MSKSGWPDAPSSTNILAGDITFPHADPRILHEPATCPFCDRYPDYQMLRMEWSIAFTGQLPTGNEVACPFDDNRRAVENRWLVEGRASLLKTLTELGDDDDLRV